jgi:UDP-N-acetylmuramyl tripeptide synthase
MENSLRALNALPHNKIIHVFGSTGGHRDVRKRFEFGQISASLADTIIITNDDVYDSDPAEIARNVEQGISESPTKKVSDVMTVLDRRSAIAKALSIAQANDIVIITGKGSEQFLVLPGDKRIPWDEPTIVKEELVKLNT